MLECNLELLLANANKSVRTSSHETRICGVAKGLQATHPVLLSQAPVSWSEPENIYSLSHDVQCILYLILLCGNIPLSTLLAMDRA